MIQKVIFVNSLFPCLSETFVYDQYETLERAGLDFVLLSNHRPTDEQVHPRMRAIQSGVEYLSEASITETLGAHFVAFTRHPLRYLAALGKILFSREKLKTTLAQFSGAALLLKRHGGDRGTRALIHSHFTYGATAVAMWAARMSRARYVLTLHGSDLLFDNPPDLAEKLREASAIVSISRYNVNFLQTHFPDVKPKQLAVIPLGVPPLSQPLTHSPSERCLRILNVGRLSNHKAQHVLIEACAGLSEKGVEYQCDIVGTGPEHTALQDLIDRLGLNERVKLLGPRFHHEVLELYGHADLFVLCSITEGMPIVLMEAMRAGVPVISSAISGIPELVQDGGILVAPSDPQAITDAVVDIVSGKVDANALATKAREIIARDFDLETNHLRFSDFLKAQMRLVD